ncbi:pimeloyl-CoA synthetase [Pseudonocardia sulfidoxydans NBRC 16205]|uniref:Pimeloyl-CoA synthetase n=1 Tax=Pseudonocardia sulfidoxydans NBRC 16205 TaxID=1223511 RepID=A0A511DGW0_9PSEU|nr:acetate--CoA ligase family protein [Pseudonocardia sulfidoxydans]GEL22238.1 pimeloyl-CoA synthetase [Pseudonocardia sulfidoxydans NBRC 16205]
MTDLSFFHAPRSVAVIGASDNPDKIGGRPIRYMSALGYAGALYPVNPSRPSIQGLPSHPSVEALPEVPEVAVIAVAGQAAVDAVATCARLGVRGCVVMSSGFGETPDPDGRRRQDEMLTTARRAGMRIVGPNTQGLASFGSGAVLGFSTMFTEEPPADGPVAVVSQSGAMCSVPYGMLRRRGIGVRYAHATGNDADVSAAELATTVVADPDVRLLLLYLEDIRSPAAVEELAEVAARRGVPVVALSGGRSVGGQRAAASHTGALANETRVVDAFFERLGIWRARNSTDLTAAVDLYLQAPLRPRRDGADRGLAIVSNSGAICVLAADAAADHDLRLAHFSPQTRERLDAVLPTFAATANPVDVTAALMTDSSLFGKVLPVISADPGVEACVIGIPVAGRGYDIASIVADVQAFAQDGTFPVAVAIAQPEVGAVFGEAGLAVFDDEATAVASLAQVTRHAEFAAAALGRPRLSARRPATSARTLDEADSLAALAGLGIPTVAATRCADAAEAVAAFDALGRVPVVLKGCSAAVTHKSDLGLVRLGLADADDVASTARELLGTLARNGFAGSVIVAPMVGAALEVMVGAHLDPVFGPVVVLGAGGTTVEMIPDVRVLLPPFGAAEARAAVASLRMAPLLGPVRGEDAADVDAWVDAAVRLGDEMTRAGSQVVSVDVNPMMLRRGAGGGAVAVDAVVLVEGGVEP